MALVLSCPRCGGDLAATAERCEQCGYEQAPPAATAPAPARGARVVARLGCGIALALLALLSLAVLFGRLLGGLLGPAAATS